MERVLITGGSGFIGKALFDYLIEKENEVFSYDRVCLQNENMFVEGSVLDTDRLTNALKGSNANTASLTIPTSFPG